MGCRQAVRQRTLTPSSRGFESRQPSQKSSRAPCGPGWIFRECGIRTREGPSVKETSRWDVFSEERRDGPHTLACGSSSQQRFAETLVDPASPATSEQSPLCDHVFFCLRHKKPPGASLPCSSSPQKVTLRLRCSLVNALTTLWLATNFFRKRARAQLFPYPASRAFAPQFSQPSQKSADAAKCLPIFTSSLFTIHFSLPGRADFWKGITKREE